MLKASYFIRYFEEIKKYGKYVFSTVVTNGTLLTKENIEVLKKVNTQLVQVTLDGGKNS